MQLFLANAYFTCQMYMNGGIDEAQLLEMQFQTLKIVKPLIDAELKYLYKEQPPNEKPPNETTTQSQVDKSIKESAKEAADAVLKQKSAKPEESPKPTDGN